MTARFLSWSVFCFEAYSVSECILFWGVFCSGVYGIITVMEEKIHSWWELEFWQELARKRQFWIGVGLVMVAIILMVTGWVVYDVAEDRRVEAVAVTVSENLTVPFGKEVKISDFVTANEGTALEDAVIDTEKLGEKRVEFGYVNARKKHHTRELALKIVDVTAPKIYGESYYTVNVGYAGDLTDLMMSGDDLDDSPLREIVGEYNVNEVGSYDLEYVVRDASGNETRKDFTLRVKEADKSGGAVVAETPKLEIAEVIREHKTAETKIGIDVSQWQGEIDWRKVKAAGVEFAMIRVGYQKGYGGEYVLDPYFRANMAGATELGLPVGVYFYSYADSVEEAKSQAEWVVQQLGDFEVKLGVAFDWEDWGNFNKVKMSFYKINRVAETFLDTIAELGAKATLPYEGMLYGSKVYLERIWQLDKYPIWLAQYYDRVTYEGDYMIWQMSDSGRVDGIEGDVDIDVMYLK